MQTQQLGAIVDFAVHNYIPEILFGASLIHFRPNEELITVINKKPGVVVGLHNIVTVAISKTIQQAYLYKIIAVQYHLSWGDVLHNYYKYLR